ncbi:hypothetical protein DV737_g256, partial [Chaetothyriales sp. CBS 132003]
MGFTNGFHTVLVQSHDLLTSHYDPQPSLLDPPVYELQKPGLTALLKDTWNAEVERLVRAVQETDWHAKRHDLEVLAGGAWAKLRASEAADDGDKLPGVGDGVKGAVDAVKDVARDKTPQKRLLELTLLNHHTCSINPLSTPHADPSELWPDVHSAIRSTITSLGGSVLPKLNWSAPKDATWMSPTNDMTCRTANDIYLLLKSSDFITHDLEHAFDDCLDVNNASAIPYHLVLRKKFEINPALEFRCFVRNRHLIAISQRDMNHFDFLFDLAPRFKSRITTFLHHIILPKFHEPSFVLDVYISPQTQSRQERVWLIDLNPWAQRTDPLLFSWLELLTMPGPDAGAWLDDIRSDSESESDGGEDEMVVRLPLKPVSEANPDSQPSAEPDISAPPLIFDPELRLVRRDDPEAYAFASTKYSAHKLPKDVVDASMTPSAMISMMEEWQRVMHGRPGEAENATSPVPLLASHPRRMPKSNSTIAASLREALFECFRATARLVRPELRRQLVLVGGTASVAHSSVLVNEDVDVAAPPSAIIDIWEGVSARAPDFTFEPDGKIAFDAPSQDIRIRIYLLEMGNGCIERIHVAEPFFEGSMFVL